MNTITTLHQELGVGVIVIRDQKILLGKRIGALEPGTWGFPGGRLEWGESVFECARREVLEETGLTNLTNFRYGPYTREIFAKENKQFITLFVIVNCPKGEPRIVEPNRCTEWQWFAWNSLPQPLFSPTAHLLEQGFILP